MDERTNGKRKGKTKKKPARPLKDRTFGVLVDIFPATMDEDVQRDPSTHCAHR
jgi:hypothetical protein